MDGEGVRALIVRCGEWSVIQCTYPTTSKRYAWVRESWLLIQEYRWVGIRMNGVCSKKLTAWEEYLPKFGQMFLTGYQKDLLPLGLERTLALKRLLNLCFRFSEVGFLEKLSRNFFSIISSFVAVTCLDGRAKFWASQRDQNGNVVIWYLNWKWSQLYTPCIFQKILIQ